MLDGFDDVFVNNLKQLVLHDLIVFRHDWRRSGQDLKWRRVFDTHYIGRRKFL